MPKSNYSEKELAIFQAVQRLLREGADPASLKVADIAAAAGIGKGTVYEYFPSKEDIFARAMAFGMHSLLDEAEATVFPEPTFAGKFNTLLTCILQNTPIWRVLLQINRQPPPCPDARLRQSARISALLEDVLRAAIAEGIMQESALAYGRQALLYLLTGFVVMYVSGLSADQAADPHETVLRMAVGALRAGT